MTLIYLEFRVSRPKYERVPQSLNFVRSNRIVRHSQYYRLLRMTQQTDVAVMERFLGFTTLAISKNQVDEWVFSLVALDLVI